MQHYKNAFWDLTAQRHWPADREFEKLTFLGRAACRLGKMVNRSAWRDDDFASLDAAMPAPIAPQSNANDDFLAVVAYKRENEAYEAGQRAQAASDFILHAAITKKLVFRGVSNRTGIIQNIPSTNFGLARSGHVFRSCTMDPANPFNPSTHVRDRFTLFVDKASCDRLVQSFAQPEVEDDHLREWIEAHTETMTLTELIAASKEDATFPGCMTPTQRRISAMDAMVRVKMQLPARARGRSGLSRSDPESED